MQTTIEQLMSQGNYNVSIPVTPKDLHEFATSVAKSVLANYQPKEKEEELLTVDEAMAMLKVSRTSCWRWERQGILRPVKIGRFVRYRKSDVTNLIEGKEAGNE